MATDRRYVVRDEVPEEERSRATDLWKPQFASFKDLLEVADATITPEAMAEAVAQLPAGERELLARGPLERRWDCRVCVCFDDLVRQAKDKAFPDGITDPRWIVYLFHEAPKNRMRTQTQLHYGALANEHYSRCIAVYRAAGWEGTEPGPNA